MPTVAVISCEPVASVICEIAKNENLDCIFYSSSTELHPTLNQARTVVLGPQGRFDEHFITVQSLRIDLCFKGSIVILSFGQAALSGASEKWGAVDSRGCSRLLLPFLIEEFVELVLRPIELSDDEIGLARKILWARRIIQQARTLRHEYENKLGLALAHLREIEKLSHFTELDSVRVSKAIEQLRLHLTRHKIETFHHDVKLLREEAQNWRSGRQVKNGFSLDPAWGDVESLLELVETAEGVRRIGGKEFFKYAKRAQESIKNTLAAITELRDEAIQVIEHDEQSSFS